MSSQPNDPMLNRVITIAQLLLKAQTGQQSKPPQKASDNREDTQEKGASNNVTK